MSRRDEPNCKNCGAPRQPGLAACRFCRTPFVANVHTQAVPCPRCSTINEWGAQKCAQCATWIVVQCVFCSALSPHHVAACLTCKEAFAGAPERLAARQAQAEQKRTMEVVGTVGGVAASFLGAMAGAALNSDWSSGDDSSGGSGGGLLGELLSGDDD